MPKFTVAIVGAGLSGLLFAITLQKYTPDVAFEIYEGASELGDIGAGIGLHRRTWALLKAAGLDQVVLKLTGNEGAGAVPQMVRKSDQPEGLAFGTIDFLEASFTFHRVELQKAFLAHLQSASGASAIRLGKRLVGYTQPEGTSGKIELRFKDGTAAHCDVLVAADGIRSAVRGIMYTKFAETAEAAGKYAEATALKSVIAPVYAGTSVGRTLIYKDAVPEEALENPAFTRPGIMVYVGKNKHLVTYPISQGQIINVAAVVGQWDRQGEVYEGPWVSTVARDEIVECFSSFEPDVQELLKHVKGFSKWAINVVQNLPTYIDGRVALMGDAAHAMTPFLGAGAGQCFEDAFLLAQFLGRSSVNAANVHIALRVYDEIRRPLSQSIAEQSLRNGRLIQLTGPEFAGLTEEQSATGKALNPEQLRELADEIGRLNNWETTTFTEENEASLLKLEEALLK